MIARSNETLAGRRLCDDPGVTSRFAALAVDAVDPAVLAAFWCEVLDWEVVEDDPDIVTIASLDRSWPAMDVVRVPEGKTAKNRLHLDLRADGSSTADELQRLLTLGARRVDVGQDLDVSWVVLADPEGNEFCLLSTAVQDL